MAEYIKREAALHEIERRKALMVGDKRVSVDAMKSFIKNRPAADVAPVVHGRWVKHYRSGTTVAEGYVSTCCDMWNNRKSDYCPNCGAKMDGDSDG
jgi:hypothetical protein